MTFSLSARGMSSVIRAFSHPVLLDLRRQQSSRLFADKTHLKLVLLRFQKAAGIDVLGFAAAIDYCAKRAALRHSKTCHCRYLLSSSRFISTAAAGTGLSAGRS
jgi:hypothetical protein